MKVVVLQLIWAGLPIINHLAAHVEINLLVCNLWVDAWRVSQVKDETILVALAGQEARLLEGEGKLVVVQQLSKRVLQHAVQDNISEEVHGVLDDHHAVLKPRVKDQFPKGVLVLHAASAPLEVGCREGWSDPTVWPCLQLDVGVKVQVAEA